MLLQARLPPLMANVLRHNGHCCHCVSGSPPGNFPPPGCSGGALPRGLQGQRPHPPVLALALSLPHRRLSGTSTFPRWGGPGTSAACPGPVGTEAPFSPTKDAVWSLGFCLLVPSEHPPVPSRHAHHSRGLAEAPQGSLSPSPRCLWPQARTPHFPTRKRASTLPTRSEGPRGHSHKPSRGQAEGPQGCQPKGSGRGAPPSHV